MYYKAQFLQTLFKENDYDVFQKTILAHEIWTTRETRSTNFCLQHYCLLSTSLTPYDTQEQRQRLRLDMWQKESHDLKGGVLSEKWCTSWPYASRSEERQKWGWTPDGAEKPLIHQRSKTRRTNIHVLQRVKLHAVSI